MRGINKVYEYAAYQCTLSQKEAKAAPKFSKLRNPIALFAFHLHGIVEFQDKRNCFVNYYKENPNRKVLRLPSWTSIFTAFSVFCLLKAVT